MSITTFCVRSISNYIISMCFNKFFKTCVYSQKLQENYTHFRRTRGDGNCFYRAFGFANMEILLQDKDELKR